MPKQAGSIAQFFKSERSGEDMYEISHRIGKGSYGVWLDLWIWNTTNRAGDYATDTERHTVYHAARAFRQQVLRHSAPPAGR